MSSVQKFDLLFYVNKKNEDKIREFLGLSFMPFYHTEDIKKYVIDNKYQIQTRHDIDDYISDIYIETIQKFYWANLDKESFLIQAQPTKLIVSELGVVEEEMPPYTDKNNSMFLTLCQKHVVTWVYQRKHRKMHEVVRPVISLPTGYVKWVIHGDNTSVRENNM